MKQPSEVSNELTTLEDQQRLLERDRIKAERKKLTRIRRDEVIKHKLSGVLLDAARKVELRQHAFKNDEELLALGLKAHEMALVRQWQEAKRNASYALESSSKQIEAHLRAQGEKQSVKINVENATIQLPPKQAETMTPVVIEVEVDGK